MKTFDRENSRDTFGHLLDSLYTLRKNITITFRPAQDSSLGLAAKARFFSSTEATHHLGCMTLNVMQTMSCGCNAC